MKKLIVLDIIIFSLFTLFLKSTFSTEIGFAEFFSILGMNETAFVEHNISLIYPVYPIAYLLFMGFPLYFSFLTMSEVNAMAGLVAYRVGRKKLFWFRLKYVLRSILKTTSLQLFIVSLIAVILNYPKLMELSVGDVFLSVLFILKIAMVLAIITIVAQLFFVHESLNSLLIKGLALCLFVLMIGSLFSVPILNYSFTVTENLNYLFILLVAVLLSIVFTYKRCLRSEEIL